MSSAWPGDSAEAGALNETEDSDETGSELPARSEEEIQQARAELRLCGISEPKRSELLALDCVTQEFIQAWCETLDYAPGPGRWTPGLLITCMEKEEWPVGKRSVEHSRQSYTEGEYADFIDH